MAYELRKADPVLPTALEARYPTLKTSGGVERWVRAIAAKEGGCDFVREPEDCERMVGHFAAVGVDVDAFVVQAFCDAYCFTMSPGWIAPWADVVTVLDDLAADIERGTCFDPNLASLRGTVAAS